MTSIFETSRLIVRRFTEDDDEIFFLLNGNAEVVRYIRPVMNKKECDEFLLKVIADANATPLYGRWAVHEKIPGAFAGSFAIIPVTNSDRMQLGYSLLPSEWGKGYATELTKAGLEYVFAQTSLDIIYAYTEKPNLASQKVLLKCGFHYAGEKKEAGKELAEFILERQDYEKACHSKSLSDSEIREPDCCQ
jgi:ribosomal-protein-alanine N-acetyltransferase